MFRTGGKKMDSFMDKIAQKFTAQDMIKANSAAEEKEMKRLRMQVAEYDERLQEMRKLNLKNLELADQLQALIAQGQEKVDAIQKDSSTEDAEGVNTLEQNVQAVKEAMDAQNQKLTEMSEQIMEHVHKEDVKVYRNVQAAVADENKVLSENLLQAVTIAVARKTKGIKSAIVLGALSMVASLASVAFWVCWLLGVF